MTYFALAIGTCTKNKDGKIIECYFPDPILNPSKKLISAISSVAEISENNGEYLIPAEKLPALAEAFESADQNLSGAFANTAMDSEQPIVLTVVKDDKQPEFISEAYLKLHLLSHRLVKPHAVVLDGIFGLLHNIAWTNLGPIDLPELQEWQIATRLRGQTLQVNSVDKFPKMVDYVVPAGIRVADTSRVRLGAYLGEGTTIMHEGFVNFNAGTEGTSMVEGRITAGVMVGKGSDVGGGASIMGTLSGGGKMVISMGENCLLGANSGVGISLGDRCIVEAGLYVTAGTKVTILDENKQPIESIKARELSGKSDMLFIRNSLSGAIECLTNKTAVELNNMLHDNN